MLQIQPLKDVDVYRYLEPLYGDYRKVRRKMADGSFDLARIDEVVGEMLAWGCSMMLLCRGSRREIELAICYTLNLETIGPRREIELTICYGSHLETIGSLEPRKSALEDDFDEEEEKEKEQLNGELGDEGYEKDYYRGRSPARERDRDRRRDSHRHSDRDYDRDYDRERGKDKRQRGREIVTV